MIFDLHNDYPTASDEKDIKRYSASVDGIITAAIWTTDMRGDVAGRVKSLTEALSALGTPAAIEDIGFLGKQYRAFDFSRYLYCSLTWNYDNEFAGGALDDGALTAQGKEVVGLMNKVGCYVDVAHLNKKSFYGVIDTAERVLCSHTGFNSHPRSLDDAQIRALIDRRAVIGLCTVTAFTDAHDATEFADVTDGFVQRYGSDNLAIGTDFNGSTDIPRDISDYDGMDGVARLLLDRGYNSVDVYKIFYGNAYGIYRTRRP